MKQCALLVIAVSMFATAQRASAAGPGQNFFGYWAWHSPGNPEHTNPRDACLDLIADLNASGTPSSFRGVTPGGATSNRDYTCLWKHDDAPFNDDQSLNALISRYVCPANATAFTLNNSGVASDFRCRCDSGTCTSPSPPAVEQSARCTQHRFREPIDQDTVKVHSARTAVRAKNADPTFYDEYTEIANELAATEDCTFAPGDFYPGTHDVNIGYLCGFRKGDEAAANNMAGYSGTPSDYVWHHDLAMGRMLLVSQTAHAACGAHIGGVAVWKEALGIIDYPFFLPPL
jgi:hypothetical protein